MFQMLQEFSEARELRPIPKPMWDIVRHRRDVEFDRRHEFVAFAPDGLLFLHRQNFRTHPVFGFGLERPRGSSENKGTYATSEALLDYISSPQTIEYVYPHRWQWDHRAVEDFIRAIEGYTDWQSSLWFHAKWMAGRSRRKGPLTEREIRKKLFEMGGGLCAYCDQPLGDSWHKDHLVPKSKGGPDVFENYVPACGKCNGSKSDHHVIEFIDRKMGRAPAA